MHLTSTATIARKGSRALTSAAEFGHRRSRPMRNPKLLAAVASASNTSDETMRLNRTRLGGDIRR